MKDIGSIADIPSTTHFAVLVEDHKSVYHEADERSRTHPGHGYPAWTENITSFQYIAFDSEEDLLSWVRINKDRKTFKILEVQPRNLYTTVSLEIGP